MKVSRNMLLLVVVAAALLAFGAIMIIFYIGAVNQTPQLEDEIQSLKVKIAQLPEYDLPGMREQLEDILDDIQNKAPFPAGPFGKDSIYDTKQITNAIFEVADDAAVSLDSLSHSSEGTVQFGVGVYRSDNYRLSCSVTDEGHAERLIDLLELFEELREDEYSTLMMDGIRIPAGGTSIQFDLSIITQLLGD